MGLWMRIWPPVRVVNSSTQQGAVAFWAPPAQGGDGPLPLWSYVVLALAFYWLASRRLREGGVGGR